MNGLNYPIKKIVEFQPYASLVELVHQASKAERHMLEELKYLKTKAFFANKPSSSTPTPSQALLKRTLEILQESLHRHLKRLKDLRPAQDFCNATSAEDKGINLLSAPTRRS